MNELLAKKVLKEVKEVLDANNVEFWLNFGGLLGAVREGRFISYDNDVELNAWSHKVSKQKMKDVSRDLCQRGFNVYYSTLTDYISIRKNNIPIGFSMYTLEGNRAVRPHEPTEGTGFKTLIVKLLFNISEVFARRRVGKINAETILGFRRFVIFAAVTATSLFPEKLKRKFAILFRTIARKVKKEYGKTSIPARFYLELQDFEFYGETFKVPNNPEEYVEFVYGPDWRIPIKDWNFHDPDKKSITGIKFLNEIWDYK
jgi:hypothetical protein